MRILLLRHGETDWNIQQRVQGREDMPLNENGLRQAEACGAALEGLRVDRAVTSPLMRAKRTCRIVASHLGIGEITEDAGLLERDFGVYSGKRLDNIFAVINCEGSEPLEAAAERIMETLKRLEGAPEETLLAVSHGAVINAMLFTLTGGKAGTGITRLRNACVNILNLENGDLRFEAWNLTAAEAAAYLKGEVPRPVEPHT